MDRFDRIYALHKELAAARRGRTLRQLAEALECEDSTAKRAIRAMRDYLGAPIVYDRELRAYRYAPAQEGGRYELPGLWFTPRELLGLLGSQQLLQRLQPGFLDQELAPLRKRIEQLLQYKPLAAGRLSGRIRILPGKGRQSPPAIFRRVAEALAERQRLAFRYHARTTGEAGERLVSPQRLVYYRDNWYLDAWDHGREGLRTFALERIGAPRLEQTAARDLDEAELDRELGASYGIFAGAPVATAVLWFSAHRARWVADEIWHPTQQTRWLPDGRFELSFPYSSAAELLGQVLQHGPHVEVRAPPELREQVGAALQAALACYE